MTNFIQWVGLYLLLLLGVWKLLGIPPITYWFRSKSCPCCHGVGHVRTDRGPGDES